VDERAAAGGPGNSRPPTPGTRTSPARTPRTGHSRPADTGRERGSADSKLLGDPVPRTPTPSAPFTRSPDIRSSRTQREQLHTVRARCWRRRWRHSVVMFGRVFRGHVGTRASDRGERFGTCGTSRRLVYEPDRFGPARRGRVGDGSSSGLSACCHGADSTNASRSAPGPVLLAPVESVKWSSVGGRDGVDRSAATVTGSWGRECVALGEATVQVCGHERLFSVGCRPRGSCSTCASSSGVC
jgi:hypothetical protein